MIKTALSGSLLALAWLAAPQLASANTFYSGLECSPEIGDASKVNYGQFGIDNMASSFARVWCPGITTTNIGTGQVTVTVYDRSETENVCCGASLVDHQGFITSQTSVDSCTGVSQWSFNSMPLFLQLSGWSPNRRLQVRCRIPASTAAHGQSHVASYETQE